MKTNNKLIFMMLSIIVIGITSVSFIVMAINNNTSEPDINSFEECSEHYAVLESDPMQCMTPNGTLFVEDEDDNGVVCTMEYAPVCGIDGVTYGNKCVAEQQNNMEIAYEGECGQENAFSEPKICTKEYMPVCGADGVTYGNRCEAGNMQITNEGQCDNQHTDDNFEDEDGIIQCTEEQKQAEFCTLEYAPVCGSDGTTHGNKCSACATKDVDYYTIGEC